MSPSNVKYKISLSLLNPSSTSSSSTPTSSPAQPCLPSLCLSIAGAITMRSLGAALKSGHCKEKRNVREREREREQIEIYKQEIKIKSI
jgi:hypothetical protein